MSPGLSIGVIGAGDIARTAHVPVLKSLDGANLAWVADVDTSRAAALGKAYKIPHFTLGQEGGSPPPADVVLLAIPYGVRAPYYEKYQKLGTAIYVEKPFARSADEHSRICALFPGHALASGLMMRCWNTNQMARDLVDSELFGPLRRARFAHGRPGMVTYGRYYLDRSKGGGGMMAEFGIHGLDSLLYVTRATSVQLGPVATVWEGDLDLHTHARFAIRSAGDRTAEGEILVTGLDDLVEGVELEFDGAVVSYLLPGQGYALQGDTPDLRITVRPRRPGGAAYTLTPRDGAAYPATKFQMFHLYWSQFLEGIRTGTENDTSAGQALLTTKLLEEIERASEPKRGSLS